jgi:hypothetical protein
MAQLRADRDGDERRTRAARRRDGAGLAAQGGDWPSRVRSDPRSAAVELRPGPAGTARNRRAPL